jgi:hypothetical protein
MCVIGHHYIISIQISPVKVVFGISAGKYFLKFFIFLFKLIYFLCF